MEKHDTSWGLMSEMRYLDGLGYWGTTTKLTRKQLLRSYIKTIHLREATWIGYARDYAKTLLSREYGVLS